MAKWLSIGKLGNALLAQVSNQGGSQGQGVIGRH